MITHDQHGNARKAQFPLKVERGTLDRFWYVCDQVGTLRKADGTPEAYYYERNDAELVAELMTDRAQRAEKMLRDAGGRPA